MFAKLIQTLFTFVLIIGLGLAIFSLQKRESYAPETRPLPSPSPSIGTTRNSPTPTANQSGSLTKEFKIIAQRFQFEPSQIKVKKGDRVKLKITSTDTTHGFAIEEFKINETIVPQKETAVEFVADKVGEFPFACSVFCGSGHGGMKGTLIIEE